MEHTFLHRLKNGLKKTRQSIAANIDGVLSVFTKIDEELFENLEEALILADIGAETSMKIIDALRLRVKSERVTDTGEIKAVLENIISNILTTGTDNLTVSYPAVFLIIGVNGAGKTTSTGKLAALYKSRGKSVMIAAADTFRAAATEQLAIWAKRADVRMISHDKGDPAAVVFDALAAAKANKTDLLLVDTAGRLHNKKNLAEELKKIRRVIERESCAHTEVFLTLDATSGQNAITQARQFNEICGVSGLILTKLDSTAKGGVVISIKDALDIPVRFIGCGEDILDLQEFNPEEFAGVLFE